MKNVSDNDYMTVTRILKWAAVMGGCSTKDANMRRQANKILKKWQRKSSRTTSQSATS